MGKKSRHKNKKLSLFLEEMEPRRSPHTLSAYKRDLTLYTDFLKKNRDISRFPEYIDKKGFSPRSRARIISSVRSYLRFLQDQKNTNQLKKLHSVSVRPGLPKFISLKEFQLLLKSAKEKESHKQARNHITLFLLFGLGCRISEMIQLDLQDINEMDMSLIVTGKRQKQRVLPLTTALFARLKDYIKQHRPGLLKGHKTHAVLINNRGRRPSRVDVYRWLTHWSQKAGFQEVKSPHQFRHGFATSLLEEGVDLRSIQLLLGHSSIQTTEIYTSVQQSLLNKTLRQHHPLSSLSPRRKK